jgi:hypothetical protein
VMLRHASGAVSTLALGVDAPPNATARELVFYGRDGMASVPDSEMNPVEALGTAIGQLVAVAAAGETGHPCDVRFGRDVVAVLAAAEADRAQGATGLPGAGSGRRNR